MNLGFYIDGINGSAFNMKIFETLNNAVKNNKIKDVSLFFNNTGHNPMPTNFGQFNATEIWYFTGTLIATTIQNVLFAKKIVNKFKLMYLFSQEDKNLIGLLKISKQVPILTTSQEDYDYVYRVTGNEPKLIENLNVENILKVL
jgi:hypothetical protein